MLRLSPNEQAQIQQQREQDDRKQRLLALRKQSKEANARQTQNYKEAYEANMSSLLQNLQEDWTEAKERRLFQLEASIQKALETVGEAYQQANLKHSLQKQEALNLKAAYVEQTSLEDRRSSLAHRSLQEERTALETEHEAHVDRIGKVRRIEDLRARQVAHSYRLAHPADILPSQSTPSHPVGLPMLQHSEVPKQPNVIRYDETYHHRDYAVVRAATSQPQTEEQLSRHPYRMADVVLKRVQKEQEQKQSCAKVAEEKAKERFDEAFYRIQMEKEKKEMMKTLERIQIDEWKRLASVVEGNRRHTISDNYHTKQAILQKFFQKKFPKIHEMESKQQVLTEILDPTSPVRPDNVSTSPKRQVRFASPAPHDEIY